jgi:DNA primase small subunit
MLDRVKAETGKLIRMLPEEMGFAQRSISVVFSGGRGYHIHIRDISIRGWGSQERREMVDYVCGIGLDPKCLSLDRNIPRSGWRGRYLSALLGYLRWLSEMPSEAAVRQLESIDGVGKKSALEFVTALPVHIGRAEQGDAGGVLASRAFRLASSCEDGEFRRRLRETAALADEPVTTDIKRLIRMPTSLHGGSGFRVTPIAAGELPEFDPLIDAVIFGEREVKVEAMMNVTMPLLGNTHQLAKGVNSVPEALAVFLCCRGIAEIAGGGMRAP